MADRDAGFTLVELIAGLLVASLLIAGIVDIVRQYATTTHRVRTIALDLRSRALADGLMAQLVRADPESSLSPRLKSAPPSGTLLSRRRCLGHAKQPSSPGLAPGRYAP